MSSEREHLSPVDAAWYRMDEHGDPADIGSVMLLDGPMDEARVRATIADRLGPHKRFHQRVVDSRHHLLPSWEDEPGFSFDAHIDARTLEAPTDAALQELLSELMSAPLDFDRSPWRLTLIHGVEGGSALFSHVHHCMGDGFALLDMLIGMADRDDAPPEPVALEPEPDWIVQARRVAHDLPAGAMSLGHLLLLPFDSKTLLSGKLAGKRHLAWSQPVPLERVKQIAHACGGTVNDVLVAAFAGAMRRWLLEHGGEAPPIRAIVPVNMRPRDVPIDDTHRNWFGLIFLDLPTDKAERQARVAAVEQEMNRIKKSKEAIVALGILATLGRAPTVVNHVVEDLFTRKASIMMTNVPGPRRPLRLAGYTLRDLWGWAPQCGLGCGATIFSYAGHVRIGVRGDQSILPYPDALARWFVEELEAVDAHAVAGLHAPAAH